MRVTISDVAARANVSTATVSYVLNNSNRVSEKTKMRVLQAVKELGYQPNALARGLVKDQTRNIGLVIPQTAEYVFSDPYFAELLKGVGTVISREGYFLLLSLITTAEELTRVMTAMVMQRRVDGILMVSTPRENEELIRLQAGRIPFLVIGPCLLPDIGSIDADNEEGSYQITKYLIDLGHERIGYITGDMRYDYAVDRYRGFQKAMGEANLPAKDVFVGDFTQDAGIQGAKYFLEREVENPVTAIACASDLMAHGVINVSRDLGYSVPDDLSVVGFDDVPLSRDSKPLLTTMRQPIKGMGRIASERLISLIETRNRGSGSKKEIVKTELVVRDSAAPPKRNPA